MQIKCRREASSLHDIFISFGRYLITVQHNNNFYTSMMSNDCFVYGLIKDNVLLVDDGL